MMQSKKKPFSFFTYISQENINFLKLSEIINKYISFHEHRVRERERFAYKALVWMKSGSSWIYNVQNI